MYIKYMYIKYIFFELNCILVLLINSNCHFNVKNHIPLQLLTTGTIPKIAKHAGQIACVHERSCRKLVPMCIVFSYSKSSGNPCKFTLLFMELPSGRQSFLEYKFRQSLLSLNVSSNMLQIASKQITSRTEIKITILKKFL